MKRKKMRRYWGEWWLLWIITIVIIILICGIETNGCWDEERDALLQLNASAPISNKWLNVKTSNCCEWEGVTCGKNARITTFYYIDLFSEQGWHVNASIFLAFQQLRQLDLSGNNIVSWTEDKGCMKLSSKLSNLQELKLGSNRLNSTIWLQLSEFQSLKSLDLSNNQLDGDLSLHGCHERLQSPHLNTSCFRALRLLNLKSNNFAGEIPLGLENLTSLETLDMSGNHFTGNIASSPLIHLLSLKKLNLEGNHLQIPDSFQFFANHTKLKFFAGDFNQVVHDVSNISNIQPSTSMGLQLELLSLSNCALHTYPSFLHHQRDLRVVDLSNNVLHGGFATWLLENNFRLTSLILSKNSLTGSLQLPSLLRCPSMKQLTIAQNTIQGHIPYNIGVVFPKLVELDLSNNRLKGSIPSSLGDLKFVRKLYLSNNHLSDGIEHLPKSSVSLNELDLSYNDFKGDIPSFEGEVLNLEGNNFSSGLKIKMFGPYLAFLNLRNNSLEGPIPDDICIDQSQLGWLDLSFNKLSGSLPNCSCAATSIYFNDNRLSGHLTDTFLNQLVRTLEVLDLTNNDLSGSVPTAIGNLTQLYALMLRGNRFHGSIPIQLCRLTGLSVLDLSSNSLHGPIPACLGRIIVGNNNTIIGTYSSTAMDSSDGFLSNQFDDEGHKIFDNKLKFVTKNMAYDYQGWMTRYMLGIDLSCNKLTGQIPHELGNLSNLHTLNVSHNKLWGGIPVSFSNLVSIESLDLSYNHLNGSIPTTLTKLYNISVFKVSYNNLSGKIPYEVGQFDTFDASSYEGNPFLCGPPLSKSCITDSSTSGNASKDEAEDHDWIDKGTFYVTFVVSGVTMFLAVVIIMLINPHWSIVLLYLVKTSITSSYHFVEDSMRRLRRVRHV